MALFDVAQVFQSNRQLQKFILTGVTPTGTVLGTGSYGAVEEVMYQHRVCAGKRLHETLIDVGNEGVREVIHRFLQECHLMASLRHPNITQFLGLCFLPGTRLPILVMERLETSLDDLLEHTPNFPLTLKRSILEDVACGLLYLHSKQPPVIHRDLTSKNVLLTSLLEAKITDMGNSRIVNMKPDQMARKFTKYPGTLVYMPPEAQNDRGQYGPPLDIFSFGHLALYTIIQKFPGDLLPGTYTNPKNDEEIRARSELERRGQYIEILESRMNSLHPTFVQLVKQCLHNAPRGRPTAEELLTRLQWIKAEVEGEYGSSIIRVDMEKLRLAKEVKVKTDLLTKQQVGYGAELEKKERRLQQLEAEVQQLQIKLQAKKSFEAEKEEKDRQLQHAQIQLMAKEADLEDRERRLQQLQADNRAKDNLLSRFRAERSKFEDLDYQVSLDLPLKLKWKRGPDMPFGMSGGVQSVVLQGKIYVEGGSTDQKSDRYKVMEYDVISCKWATLPVYKTQLFTMAVIKNQLVLVGGLERDLSISKELGVWRVDHQWTHPYPDMKTARSACSTAVHTVWLVVAGGYNDGALTSVEVLNTDTKQWQGAPPMPTAFHQMKTATVNDILYCMGGFREAKATELVYSMSIPALIQHINSHLTGKRVPKEQIWRKLPGLQLTWSAPLSIRGSLLALGGKDKDKQTVRAIHLYHPDTGIWIKVGDLPTPRKFCTCSSIADREIFVFGGMDGGEYVQRMDIALL